MQIYELKGIEQRKKYITTKNNKITHGVKELVSSKCTIRYISVL